ncbi:MAG: hypothetical protein CMD84_01055 [Gammaproteobacteria bacterium]|jgi:putative ubiquitin-RnfH superfamily antitoxin RatB of RatAB toxin-antitoxin module|nr:hypothetical protein [Gammaproteobacteria bacterium]|tara:strand:- start:7580 stop:7867 length:288 start_codon:yes stop_codon:yes gene_type:complete
MSYPNFEIDIYYIKSKKLYKKKYLIRENLTLGYFLKTTNIKNFYSDYNKNETKFGVFGKIISNDYIFKKGDRIEIYQQALKDPKKSRKRKILNKK